MSSMYRFQTVGLKTVLLKLCVSICTMKMLEKKLLSLCSSRYRGFVLTVLYIKRERIFFEDSSKQKTFGFSTFDFSIKFIKSVASLRCDFVILILVVAMYLYQQQKKEILSLRPSDES